MLNKLNTVPYEETKYLVRKFFKRIIDLKELENKSQLQNSELQVILNMNFLKFILKLILERIV